MAGIETSISVDDMLTPRIDDMVSSLTVAIDRFEQLDVASNSVAHIRVNTDGLVELETQVGRAESAFRSLGGTLAGLGIGYLVKEQFSSAVEYASDLTEVENVVGATFEDNSKIVDEWAQNTIDSVGLSELSAKRYAGTMGAMLKSSGLTGKAVEDMSMSITELSGDMASFYNLDTDVSFEKIRSGISGETEPLKQLGINMSVANLEAYALAEGINTAYSEMSQAEQTTLRYNYLIAKTKDAQGDYANTADTYANQVRHLEQSWQAFTGELASDVLPILNEVVGALGDGVEFLSDHWDVIAPILGTVVGTIGTYIVATKSAEVATRAWHIANQLLSGGLTANISTIGMIGGAITGTIGLLYSVVAIVNEVAGTSISATGIIVGAISVAGGFIWNIVMGLVNGVIGIGVTLWNLIASFANAFRRVWDDPIAAIAHLFMDLFDTIVSIVEDAAAIIDFVLGTDMAGSIQGFREDMQSWVDDMVGEQVEYVAKLDASDYQIGEHMDLADTWDAGYYAGSNLFGGNGEDEKVNFNLKDSNITDPLNNIANDTSNTAANTAAMADSLDITSQSIKYIRDFASQRAINRYTGTTVNIEMTNNNQVSGDADVDSIARRLVATLQTEINTSMEGVH